MIPLPINVWDPSLSYENRAKRICLVGIRCEILSGTHCLVYQDIKTHLSSWAILSTHITSYTFVSLVNTDYVWVSLNRKEKSRRNKLSPKDEASQLRASKESMTRTQALIPATIFRLENSLRREGRWLFQLCSYNTHPHKLWNSCFLCCQQGKNTELYLRWGLQWITPTPLLGSKSR